MQQQGGMWCSNMCPCALLFGLHDDGEEVVQTPQSAAMAPEQVEQCVAVAVLGVAERRGLGCWRPLSFTSAVVCIAAMCDGGDWLCPGHPPGASLRFGTSSLVVVLLSSPQCLTALFAFASCFCKLCSHSVLLVMDVMESRVESG